MSVRLHLNSLSRRAQAYGIDTQDSVTNMNDDANSIAFLTCTCFLPF